MLPVMIQNLTLWAKAITGVIHRSIALRIQANREALSLRSSMLFPASCVDIALLEGSIQSRCVHADCMSQQVDLVQFMLKVQRRLGIIAVLVLRRLLL